MEGKIACSECNAMILLDTAYKNKGLCVPCFKGYRKQIEESKKYYAEAKRYRASDEYAYWVNLSQKVSSIDDLKALHFDDQVYFAVNILIGEVFNGGFHQFFFNSSGDYYIEVRKALIELKALKSLELLDAAKVEIFENEEVSVERAQRYQFLQTENTLQNLKLDQLDKVFYTFPDQLDEKILQFAQLKNLFTPFE